MRILFDYQTFDLQKFGGISRYFFELISEFDLDEEVEWELPITYSDNEYLKSLPNFKNSLLPKKQRQDYYKKFLKGINMPGKLFLFRLKSKLFPLPQNSTYTIANKEKSILKIKEGNFDIFHPTYYDTYFLDYIDNKPFVLTVYDVIHQIFPEIFLYDLMDKTKSLLQKAAKIAAISESTKRDLVSIFGIDEQKVVVTHLANSLNPISNFHEEFKNRLPKYFLLFVGVRKGYKNFLFFIQIFAALIEENKDLTVVCTGTAFDDDELFFFNKAGVSDKLHHFYVNDAELSFLYKNAIAFIFPSMYEGFGLPVLEAFSCGCPVLLSNSSSLSEIGGDAAIYFEPKNPSSMMEALRKVLYNQSVREECIQRGFFQLQKFSWEKTATETKNIYKQVLSAR